MPQWNNSKQNKVFKRLLLAQMQTRRRSCYWYYRDSFTNDSLQYIMQYLSQTLIADICKLLIAAALLQSLNSVYTTQPVVKPVTQPVVNPVKQPAASCKQTFNRLFKRFDNRFYRVNGVLGFWAGLLRWRYTYRICRWLVGWLEFNVPFQHKYGYIRDDRICRNEFWGGIINARWHWCR